MKHEIYSERPAKCLGDAFVLGNGSLGATVYGGLKKEQISLNHDTLWSGFPRNKDREGAYRHLGNIRSLIDEKKLGEAAELIHSEFLSDFNESYQPAGTLILDLDGISNSSSVRRSLSLDRAVCKTSIQTEDREIVREHFCSNPHQVFVTRLHSDKEISGMVQLTSPHPFTLSGEGGVLTLCANVPARVEPSYYECEHAIWYEEDGQKGMGFAITARVMVQEGKAEAEPNGIRISGCKDVLILVHIVTGFSGFDQVPETNCALLCARSEKESAHFFGQCWESLLEAHLQEYCPLYESTCLNLTQSTREISAPLEQQLRNAKEAEDYRSLCELIFQFGRYLLISSSREGTQPANLQGIWNEEIRPPWSSNYTFNINTEMNYWPAEACGLHTCHLPLLQMVRELAQTGAKTAESVYHMRGWVVHHNTDLWRQSTAVCRRKENPIAYAFWPFGGVWLCQQLWQMYEFTKDEALLEELYPLLKGAAEFMLDYLWEDESGKLVTSPSTSPENFFLLNGEKFAAYKMCTMDIALLKELFAACLSAACRLHCGRSLCEEIKAAQEKLCDYRIGSDGRLPEWFCEFEETEPHHRHMSHLLGLYPGQSIDTPVLRDACRKSMETRGDEGAGWSLAWKACLWAALGDGNSALRLTKQMLALVETDAVASPGSGVYPNLLCSCPPFQIDGNFGITAAIASFIVQSSMNDVYLLAALPDEFSAGSVSGFCARGSLLIDMEWKDKRVVRAEITAKKEHSFSLHINGSILNIYLKPGEKYIFFVPPNQTHIC